MTTTDIHMRDGKWFFRVNEGHDYGPYESFTAAEHGWSLYLSSMSPEEPAKEAKSAED